MQLPCHWATLANLSIAHSNDFQIEAERLVSKFAEESGSPGLSVSVGGRGRLIWSKGFGFADVEQQVRVDPAVTKFRVGSTVKPMTALALVNLVEQGRVDLDADVRRYVPSFPEKEHPFTVRQLAGHLAGIRHYAGDEAYRRTRYADVLTSLKIFRDDPLIGVPGAEWKYSSYGFNLLSAVIENAAEKPFLDYLSATVFVPLKMKATVPDYIEALVPGRGRYYFRRDGKIFNEPEVDNSYKWASGGILSTTDDLVRFGLAHMDKRVVSAEKLRLLWTEQKTLSGADTGYGIGWRIVLDEEGGQWIGHGGGSIGGTTQLWLFPENGLVMAMASNLTELDYADVLPKLRKLFIEQDNEKKPQGSNASE